VSRRRQPRRAQRHRCEQVIRELAVPVPFSMEALQERLEKYSGQPVQVEPAALAAAAPIGAWLCAEGTNYLYYDERAAPFHQAQTVLFLAARMLLSDPAVHVHDRGLQSPRLFPEIDAELVRLMAGETTPDPASDMQADAFAFAALGRDCQVGCLAALRALRQLKPLHAALLAAVPGTRCEAGDAWHPRRRLYQAVVEICDRTLALLPYRDDQAAASVSARVLAAGLGQRQAAAETEAAILAEAIPAWEVGQRRRPLTAWPAMPFTPEPDLASEATWLALVSRAFARYWLNDEQSPQPGPGDTPDGGSRSDT
jgi:hypothetical protein